MDKVTLLPCPFCGGDAFAGVWGIDWARREHRVSCANECGAAVSSMVEANAIAAWNTCATPAPDSEKLREALTDEVVLDFWMRYYDKADTKSLGSETRQMIRAIRAALMGERA